MEYSNEGPNTMIFTSNKGPEKRSEFFSEDSSLLCALALSNEPGLVVSVGHRMEISAGL